MFLTSLKKWLFSALTFKTNVGPVRFLGMGVVGQLDDGNPVKQSFFFFFFCSRFILVSFLLSDFLPSLGRRLKTGASRQV